MRNFVQEGEILNLTAPYARSAGQGALIGAQFGVAVNDVENGAAGEFATCGVFDLTKVGSQAWATLGLRIHWYDSNKRCTTDSAAGPFIGVNVATVGSGSGETTGRVKICCCASDLLEGNQGVLAADLDETPTGIAVNDSGTTAVATAAELGATNAKLNSLITKLQAAGLVSAS